MSKWDNLAAWWAEGIPIAVIAERVGVTCQAVWAAANYRRLSRHRVPVWNEENITKLRTWWGEGLKTREIAERLGTTRGAVIGKADRIGLPPHALRKPTVTEAEYHDVTQSPDPNPGVAVSTKGGSVPTVDTTPRDDREGGDSVVIPDDGLQGHYYNSVAAHEALALADSPREGMVALWIDPHSPMSVFAMGLMLAMDGASELNVAGAAVAWPENMPLFTDHLHEFIDRLIEFEAAFRAQHGNGNAAALGAEAAQ